MSIALDTAEVAALSHMQRATAHRAGSGHVAPTALHTSPPRGEHAHVPNPAKRFPYLRKPIHRGCGRPPCARSTRRYRQHTPNTSWLRFAGNARRPRHRGGSCALPPAAAVCLRCAAMHVPARVVPQHAATGGTPHCRPTPLPKRHRKGSPGALRPASVKHFLVRSMGSHRLP